MTKAERILWPISAGLGGALLLTIIYFGIVTIVESVDHAVSLFWEDRWVVLPMIVGFGIQMALYVVLKKKIFLPIENVGPSGVITGASGTTSSIAMVACCTHRVADVLPILGLTAAATFLAEYQTLFQVIGLSTTFIGIAVMVRIIIKERKKGLPIKSMSVEIA